MLPALAVKAGIDLLERFDGHAALRNGLRKVATICDEWAGIPMPLTDEKLVIHTRYPNAEALSAIGRPAPTEPDAEFAGAKIRNTFWSVHKRSHIIIFELADGRIDWGVQPGVHHLEQSLRTLGCSEAWGIEQEGKAIDLLGTLLPHRHFKQYLLTGSFLERSKRSGVTYLFRRLKPTVAIVTYKVTRTKVLCALCLHPIAYYAGSWGGAMCPTDDVVAHLMLMRGDEPMFWRRANQHPAWLPQAGL